MLNTMQKEMLEIAFTHSPEHIVAIFKGAVHFCDFDTIDYIMQHYAEQLPQPLKLQLAVAMMGMLAKVALGEITVTADDSSASADPLDAQQLTSAVIARAMAH